MFRIRRRRYISNQRISLFFHEFFRWFQSFFQQIVIETLDTDLSLQESSAQLHFTGRSRRYNYSGFTFSCHIGHLNILFLRWKLIIQTQISLSVAVFFISLLWALTYVIASLQSPASFTWIQRRTLATGVIGTARNIMIVANQNFLSLLLLGFPRIQGSRALGFLAFSWRLSIGNRQMADIICVRWIIVNSFTDIRLGALLWL